MLVFCTAIKQERVSLLSKVAIFLSKFTANVAMMRYQAIKFKKALFVSLFIQWQFENILKYCFNARKKTKSMFTWQQIVKCMMFLDTK